jgi:hypothetical protein
MGSVRNRVVSFVRPVRRDVPGAMYVGSLRAEKFRRIKLD